MWNENDETVSFAPPSSPIVLPGYRNLDFTGPYLPIKLSLGNSQIIKDDGIDKDDYGNFYVSLENNLQSVTKRVQSITKESEG